MINLDKMVHVSIGEVKTGKGEDVLVASLGSCVGIAFIWKKKGIFGLAHCLLPDAPTSESVINARFVSQAVPSLFALMKIKPEDRSEVDAVIAGGGNMTAAHDADPKNLVGTLNTDAAQKYLKQYGITLIHKDIGGTAGRKITVHCNSGEYSIKQIPRILKAGA